MKKTPKSDAFKDVDVLRSTLDTRLSALEEALADPRKHSTLEALMLDLARVATDEAEATARRTVQNAEAALAEERRLVEAAAGDVATAQQELAAVRARFEQEQKAHGALQKAHAEAQKTHADTKSQLAAAMAALEKERGRTDRLEEAAEQARAEASAERAAVESQHREIVAKLHDFAGRYQALEQQLRDEQSAHAATGRELVQARAAVEAEQAASVQAAESIANHVRDVDALRAELATLRGELNTSHGVAASAEAELAAVRESLNVARQQAEQAAQELSASRHEMSALRQDLEAARRELASASDEAERLRGDAAARAKSLSQSQADQDRALSAAQDAARTAGHQAQETSRLLDEAVREREVLAQDLRALQDERDRLTEQLSGARDEAARDRESLRRQVDEAHEERDGLKRRLSATADDAARDHHGLEEELAAVQHERDALRTQLASVINDAAQERETFMRDLATAKHELDSARSAAEAAVRSIEDREVEIDLTAHSRDEERLQMFENRVRALELALRDAETRAEAAELEIEQLKLSAQTSTAPQDSAAIAASAHGVTSAEPSPEFFGPARTAKRVAIAGNIEIQVDSQPGRLIDVSMTGAQVVTTSSMKPNRMVKLTIPAPGGTLTCKAKVAWARLEPKSGQLWYRAGMAFTAVDQGAMEGLLRQYLKQQT